MDDVFFSSPNDARRSDDGTDHVYHASVFQLAALSIQVHDSSTVSALKCRDAVQTLLLIICFLLGNSPITQKKTYYIQDTAKA